MFFDVFKGLCERKGISPKRAAEDMGLSNSITTKWKKTGATPNGETLNRIADYFGVTADYLLSGEERENVHTPENTRAISDDDIMFALWGNSDDVDKEDLDDVKRYATFIRERKKKK